MKNFKKIISKHGTNTVYINMDQVSSIDINYSREKIDCGDEGIKDVEFLEVIIKMKNGNVYIDNNLYVDIEEIEKEYNLK
jgi:hypothetical protein